MSKPENVAAEKPPLWARRSHLGDGSWRATEDSLAKMRAMDASYLVGTPKGSAWPPKEDPVRAGAKRRAHRQGTCHTALVAAPLRPAAAGPAGAALTRDQLLWLGAAKHEAGRAANLVTVSIPKAAAKCR
jgi:hypothetical protein